VSFDPRYLEGVALFNRGAYFEAHDVWEALWKETPGEAKNYLQGLIQMTSAFHHFTRGNMRGAQTLHNSALHLLAPYGDSYMGLDVKRLRALFQESFRDIAAGSYEALAGRTAPGVKIPFTKEKAFTLEITE